VKETSVGADGGVEGLLGEMVFVDGGDGADG
jgi:hypothetical protein